MKVLHEKFACRKIDFPNHSNTNAEIESRLDVVKSYREIIVSNNNEEQEKRKGTAEMNVKDRSSINSIKNGRNWKLFASGRHIRIPPVDIFSGDKIHAEKNDFHGFNFC